MKNKKFMFDGASAALRYGELLRITTQKQSKQKQKGPS